MNSPHRAREAEIGEILARVGVRVAWRWRERYPMDADLDAAIVRSDRWSYGPKRPSWVGADRTSEGQPLFAAPHPHHAPEAVRLTDLDRVNDAIEERMSAAPEDGVLVPREPTDEMLIAGRAAFDRPGSGGRFSEVYRAMIAASPSNHASASADQGGE